MSVSNQETQFPYTGNGVTVTFPYNCQLQQAGDLDVYIAGLLVTSGYTINGVGSSSGGSVTFTTAPAAGVSVLLERVVELERTTDYQQNGDFLARVVNPDFDRIWMALQQLSAYFARVLRFPRGEVGINTELPDIATRANNLLGFDSQGNPIAVAPTAQSASALALLLSSSNGASNVGFKSPSALTPSAQTLAQVADREISLANYAGYDPTGATDNAAILQEAIDDAAARGIYTVKVLGIIRVDAPITMRLGVTLDGEAAVGYYAGMFFYASANEVAGPKSRIIAGAVMADRGIIEFDSITSNASGFAIRNLIIDCDKKADYGILMNPATLSERVNRFEDIIVQGAVKNGIYMSNVLVQMWRNVTVSACQGYGVNFPFGVSDSQFESLYIHTCSAGAINIGDGSSNLHFRGGKWEDNYGTGLNCFSSIVSGTQIYLTDISINANNFFGIDNNGAVVFLDGCTVYSHNAAAASCAFSCSAGLIDIQGGTIYSNSVNFRTSGSGVINANGPTLENASVANWQQTGGSLSAYGDKREGLVRLRNPGARRIAVPIAASSSATISFKDALDGFNPTNFDMKAYDLNVTYAQFPGTLNVNDSFIGQAIVGKDGLTTSAGVRTLAAATATGIAAVSAAVAGNDIQITIQTGPTFGASGGNGVAYVTLIDIGHNVYK